jgi:hypothetical protein
MNIPIGINDSNDEIIHSGSILMVLYKVKDNETPM